MRKIALFLALCLSLSLLGGCAGSGSTTGAPPSSTPEAAPSDADGSAENEPLFAGDLEDYDFSSSAESGVNAFDLQLLHAQAFSDGLAWVKYEDESGNLTTSVINTDGFVCFSLPVGVNPNYMSPFEDGYAYYRIGDAEEYETSNEVIVDANGKEYYRTQNSESAKQWIHIVGYANGHFLCCIETTGLEAITYQLALMQPDGTVTASVECDYMTVQYGNYDYVDYYGEGWYSLAGSGWDYRCIRYVNFEKQAFLMNPAVDQLAGEFSEGTAMAWTIINKGLPAVLKYVDTDLNVVQETSLRIEYAENERGFFQYDNTCGDNSIATVDGAFYDYHGNLICQVTDYPNLAKTYSRFYDGYALLLIEGADGDIYVTVVDQQGKIQFEPYDLAVNGKSHSDFIEKRIYDNYLILQDTSGAYVLMDMSGKIVHSIAEDFPGYEIRTIEEGYSEGYAVITYTKDGITYQKHYPVVEAAAAGDSVYDVGSLSAFTEASGNPSYNPEEYGFMFISDFSIEGKWKSVGDSGFGQAQPGAIVAFDGTNCNFFSPKDTYALYQDGDTYKLDVTSYLFADTLTFTVNTVSEDYIVITSGQTVTTLERVE